jgi:hypothetical protein
MVTAKTKKETKKIEFGSQELTKVKFPDFPSSRFLTETDTMRQLLFMGMKKTE